MKKLMIVDDSTIMRRAIEGMLKDLDLDLVATAGDGKQAVDLFKEHKPDLVTLDITMPEMDGLEALKQIKLIDADATVIIISALSSKATALQAMKLGAKAYIMKPIDPAKLKETIENL